MSDQPSLFAAPPVAVIVAKSVPAASCEHCARARSGVWGTYFAGCLGCRARLVARSRAAYDALDPLHAGDRQALREMTARVLHEMPLADARKAVFEWWRSDHADRETS